MFYDDGNIKVDNTRYMIGNKTIPISSISSVEPTKKTYPDKVVGNRTVKPVQIITGTNNPVAIAGGALVVSLLFFFGFTDLHWFSKIGLAFAIAFIVEKITSLISPKTKNKTIPAVTEPVYESILDDYHVTITTAGGESSTYQNTDKEKILAIVEAINQAIIQRG